MHMYTLCTVRIISSPIYVTHFSFKGVQHLQSYPGQYNITRIDISLLSPNYDTNVANLTLRMRPFCLRLRLYGRFDVFKLQRATFACESILALPLSLCRFAVHVLFGVISLRGIRILILIRFPTLLRFRISGSGYVTIRICPKYVRYSPVKINISFAQS